MRPYRIKVPTPDFDIDLSLTPGVESLRLKNLIVKLAREGLLAPFCQALPWADDGSWLRASVSHCRMARLTNSEPLLERK